MNIPGNMRLLADVFSGYNAAYYGAITGGKGNVSMNNGLWQLTGDSGINSLTARNSRVQSEEKGAFETIQNPLRTAASGVDMQRRCHPAEPRDPGTGLKDLCSSTCGCCDQRDIHDRRFRYQQSDGPQQPGTV